MPPYAPMFILWLLSSSNSSPGSKPGEPASIHGLVISSNIHSFVSGSHLPAWDFRW